MLSTVNIQPGQLYRHYKQESDPTKRRAKVLGIARLYPIPGFREEEDWVFYIHEGEELGIVVDRIIAKNPEYLQDSGQSCKYSQYFEITGQDGCFELVPSNRDRLWTIVYARSLSNFLQDLGDGKQRFVLDSETS